MNKILLIVLALFFQNNCFAFTAKHLAKLKSKKDLTYEDLAHENPGCPENSDCSAVNGKKIKRWVNLLKSFKSRPRLLSIKLERYRQKHGLPVLFLMKEDKNLIQSIDPIVWDSRCRQHNLKDKIHILKAMQFFRNNPKSESIIFTKVKTAKGNFQIPYGDQPLMYWKKGLVVIKDYDEFLYNLWIGPKGNWKVIDLPKNLIKKARVSKNNLTCSEKAKSNDFFIGSYCSQIWNEDDQDYLQIEQSWPCP